jgi:serine-type D-Ala-D-Ala carboxypeptidase/endopeptidase
MRALTMTIVTLGLASPLWGQWRAPASDSLEVMLTERIARGGSTGLVLGVLEQGVPRVVAAGHRDGPGGAPLDARTGFEIGSVSKVFTTTLLGEMVARGEVALDDPIQKYLPDSVRAPSKNGKAITLLDLATQSSGLPRLPSNLDLSKVDNPYAHYGVQELYAFLSSYSLPREPGASYEYSNLGVGLLGHLLARRLGLSYEAAVTERVLEPLGMHDTRLVVTPGLRERMVGGHGVDLEPVPSWDFDVLAGAGGWHSTAADMLRLLAAQLHPPAGPLGEGIRLAIVPRRNTTSPGLRIGLGWHVLVRGDDQVVWHNGQTAGYHSFIGFRPSTGANVLVLSNAAGDIDDLGIHVLDPSVPLRELPAAHQVVSVSADVLGSLVGTYQLAPNFSIEVTLQGDKLFARATNQPAFRLFPEAETRFFLRGVNAEVSFVRDSSGVVTGLVLHQGGRDSPGTKVR